MAESIEGAVTEKAEEAAEQVAAEVAADVAAEVAAAVVAASEAVEEATEQLETVTTPTPELAVLIGEMRAKIDTIENMLRALDLKISDMAESAAELAAAETEELSEAEVPGAIIIQEELPPEPEAPAEEVVEPKKSKWI